MFRTATFDERKAFIDKLRSQFEEVMNGQRKAKELIKQKYVKASDQERKFCLSIITQF